MVYIKESYHKRKITSSMWQDPFRHSRKDIIHPTPSHVRGTSLDFPTSVKEQYTKVEVMPISSYLKDQAVDAGDAGKTVVAEKENPHLKPTKHGSVWYVRHKETGVSSGATDFVNTYTYTVPDGMVVFLKALGHTWHPNTTFKIVIDDNIFADYDYQWGTPDNLFKFPEGSKMVRKHIKFYVKNADTSNHDYDVVFSGWIESISDVKG